ncbi:hypothetical protein QIW31_05745 [Francisellaceae bacterium CB299]|jgi:hypothetical protein
MKKIFWIPLALLIIMSGVFAYTYTQQNNQQANAVVTTSNENVSITKEEVDQAQQAWGDGILNIGKIYREKGDVKQFTETFLRKMYTFNRSNYIFFRPTLAANEGFRPNFDSALSYFIGTHNFVNSDDRSSVEGDDGFAIKPWTKITFVNDQEFKYGSLAIVMGHYIFTDDKGDDTKVEYTFVYKKVDGNLKILVQHSSLPFGNS